MNSKEASRGARALGFQSAASSGAGNCRERFERTAIQTTLNLASITQAILVADHLSFRRAARILGIRQSGISRRVSELESQIGVALFERHASGIRITNAGTLFLQQARDALQQLDCAAKIAASAGTGTLGHLNVGILSSISSDRLRLLVEDYHARHPDIFIHFFEASSSDHVLSVLKRALDVAFISDRRLSNDCEKLSMWAESICVVLPKDHRLCTKDEIECHDLRNERIFVRRSDRDHPLFEQVVQRLTVKGTNIVNEASVGRETMASLVEIGLGIGISSQCPTAPSSHRTKTLPLAGYKDSIHAYAIWLPYNDNPALRRFLSVARNVVRAIAT